MTEDPIRLGDMLPALSRQIGLTNEDFDELDRVNDHTPAVPMEFDSDGTS